MTYKELHSSFELEATGNFMNMDDKHIRGYSKKVSKDNQFTYSYEYKTDVKGKFVKFNKNFEPVIKVKGLRKEFELKISTFGKHSIYLNPAYNNFYEKGIAP